MDAMLSEVDGLSAHNRAWSSGTLSAAASAEQALLERAAALAAS
jgi:hypothetical protein